MPNPGRRSRRHSAALILIAGCTAAIASGFGLMTAALMMAPPPSGAGCGDSPGGPATIDVAGASGGVRAGATEYGGPADPSSSTVGASGASLLEHPDSFAELGGDTFQSATAMGGLAYMTPLRVSWRGRSAIAYKRDFGLGGAPVSGLPRVIDLWWQFARTLGIPYERGRWSGAVRLSAVSAGGSANLLDESPDTAAVEPGAGTGTGAATCASPSSADVPIAAGSRAQLLPGGRAAAPADAPAAVRGIIAAGNQIQGRPYVYGAAHGVALDDLAPAYDCSSSVEHLLYGGGLLPVDYSSASGALESFGRPGPGRWVTIFASADHVFMYVAGLRWDTHDAAGPGDGSTGIGWHPLVRSSAGFVERHPVGL